MKRGSGSLLSSSISESLRPSSAKRSRAEINEIDDTESCLEYIRSLFPTGAFDPPAVSDGPAQCFPPVILKHQLYSILTDRTAVDRYIVCMRDKGQIRLIKLGVTTEDYGVVMGSDYRSYISSIVGGSTLGRKVMGSLLERYHDVSVGREQLVSDLKFTEEEISQLVSKGVLLLRDVGKVTASWWFAIPGVSPFIKSLTKGRGMLRQMIGRSKFKEVLRRDIESRKMSVSKLPMEYHIHDIIGADVVERVETTSGDLLRLIQPSTR